MGIHEPESANMNKTFLIFAHVNYTMVFTVFSVIDCHVVLQDMEVEVSQTFRLLMEKLAHQHLTELLGTHSWDRPR